MKLRLKIEARRCVLELPSSTSPSSTLQSVKEHIAGLGVLQNDCRLSLNGQDELDETQSLSELGIISGDLLHVILEDNSTSVEDVVGRTETGVKSTVSVIDNTEMMTGLVPTDSRTIPSSNSRYHEYCCHVQSGLIQHDSETKLLCLALHTLMLDSGYISLEEGHSQDGHSTKWIYSTPINQQVKVHLACIKIGKTFSIHGMAVFEEYKLSASLAISLSEYITRESSSNYQLHKTRHLANTFKDNISNKLITELKKVLGLPEVGTFTCLLPEVKLLVLRYLDVSDVLAVSATSKELYCLCQDTFLWKHLLLRDYPLGQGQLPWKQLYVEHHKMAVEERRQRRRQFEAAAIGLPHFQPLPFNPLPSIIGGRHDWLPPSPWPSPNPFRLHGDHFNPLNLHRDPSNHHPIIRDHVIQSHDQVSLNLLHHQRSRDHFLRTRNVSTAIGGGPLARLRL